MMLKKFQKCIAVISLVYIVLAFVFYALNGFNLEQGVVRYKPEPCPETSTLSLSIDAPSYCTQTADLRIHHHLTWISWHYFSKWRGYDIARYVPLDVSLIALINMPFYFAKANKSKTKNKTRLKFLG